MPKDSLIIESPRQGMASSPHTGFSATVNLDLDTVPGVTKLNNIMVKASGSTVTNQINWFVRNPVTTGEIYALDSAGVVYKSTDSGDTGSWAVLSGNVTTSASGNGLWIWKDYLFVARDATLDTYGPLTGATFTVTVASPAVFSKTAHGLAENDTIIFSTTGALPTGLTAGTVYYVIAGGLTADAFEVSTSAGGAAVNTSGTQSGTHKYRAWKSTNSFKTIDSDTDWHPMLTSKNDNKLYGGAGKYVFSLDEVSGQTFTPNVSATLTWTQQALDLPPEYRIKCIEELGGYLMLGTWQGTAVTNFPVADIFPWDRSSASFGQPISLKEFGVHAMLNIGSSLVVLAGVGGTIYGCNGASAWVIGQVPGIIPAVGLWFIWSPCSIVYWRNKVYFGIGASAVTTTRQGVYSLKQTGQGNILNLEYLNSQLTDGTTVVTNVGALLLISRNALAIGWQSDTSYGIDVLSSASYAYTTDYSGYFETALYRVGEIKSTKLFTELDFLLAKKLATGEGIRIKYRTNLTDSFTTLGTYTYSSLGAVFSHFVAPGIPKCEMIQFRVELLGTATTTPEFKALILG